jgi:hypothetical protein
LKFQALAAALAIAVLGLGEARANCDDPMRPQVMSPQEFKETPLGTLALGYTGGRFLAFKTLGCYDMSSFGIRDRRFYLNTTQPDVEPSYLAAMVSRSFSVAQGNFPALSLELFRNGSERNRDEVWIDADEQEAQYRAGSRISGSEFNVLYSEYDPQTPIDVAAAGGYSQMDISGSHSSFETWHALLSQVSGVPDPQEGYRVLANSRKSINVLTEGIEALRNDGVATLRTKAYLIKFTASPEPSFDRDMLRPGPGDCLYIKYRIGGNTEPPIESRGSADMLVLKMARGAVC